MPTADETPVNEVALLDSPLQAEVEGASTEEQVTNTQEVAYQKPNTLAMLASAPRTTILYILIGLASLIFISLVLKIAIARHIQHKDLILHGVLLLIVIITGIIFNMLLSDYFGEITHVNNEKSLISIR